MEQQQLNTQFNIPVDFRGIDPFRAGGGGSDVIPEGDYAYDISVIGETDPRSKNGKNVVMRGALAEPGWENTPYEVIIWYPGTLTPQPGMSDFDVTKITLARRKLFGLTLSAGYTQQQLQTQPIGFSRGLLEGAPHRQANGMVRTFVRITHDLGDPMRNPSTQTILVDNVTGKPRYHVNDEATFITVEEHRNGHRPKRGETSRVQQQVARGEVPSLAIVGTPGLPGPSGVGAPGLPGMPGPGVAQGFPSPVNNYMPPPINVPSLNAPNGLPGFPIPGAALQLPPR